MTPEQPCRGGLWGGGTGSTAFDVQAVVAVCQLPLQVTRGRCSQAGRETRPRFCPPPRHLLLSPPQNKPCAQEPNPNKQTKNPQGEKWVRNTLNRQGKPASSRYQSLVEVTRSHQSDKRLNCGLVFTGEHILFIVRTVFLPLSLSGLQHVS